MEVLKCEICKCELVPKAKLLSLKMFQSDLRSIRFFMLRHECSRYCLGGLVQSYESHFVGSEYRRLFQKYREKFR